MPHKDPQEACDVIWQYLAKIPAWPQLPRRSFRENMYVQYGERFPGLVVDMEREKVLVDRARAEAELEPLYLAYLEDQVQDWGISTENAAGLHAFLARKDALVGALAVKGQVTGPISMGLQVTDQALRPILYDEVLADALAKHLRLKATWMERQLRRVNEKVIVSLDEPYLSAFGSAFISLSREQIITALEECFAGLTCMKGVHCCGNTDWSVVLETSVQMLSLDAYGYAESLSLYPEAVRAFLQRGGIIAWGIVPVDSEEQLMAETSDSLTEKLVTAIKLVASKGVPMDALLASAFVTTTCGMRTLSVKGAEHALSLLAGVSQKMRQSYIA
jgi:methionine synthase II (cobalamin-independent)